MFLLRNKPRFNLGIDHVERPYKTSGEPLSTKQLNLPINSNPFIRKGKSNEWAINISDDDEHSYGSKIYNDDGSEYNGNAIITEECSPLIIKQENDNDNSLVINQEENQQQSNETDESDMEIDIDIYLDELPGPHDKRKKIYKKRSFPSYKLKSTYK